MNLKNAMNRTRSQDDVDVNIIPVMNIFLLLIPFLLLTAAFVKIAVLEISLPSLGRGAAAQEEIKQKNLILVILSIKEKGFQVKSPGFKFDPLNKIGTQYNYNELKNQLKQIKTRHGHAEDIIISPESKVKYDIIIKTMDQCRDAGFPNVSLAG
ncbi:MAG: biopolymer transporter ExbD [candidate division KSB1 bacterium]|jgi:biopolymer transport protein ExbD|nr:biopolymer transporter ExbD [candidate division KSB1 bacterium]